ncbi:hypothetical protein T484DRAFT_1785523 [Baffinella frigidus]|nr:hypothetical protein T484DRAFT_1785523 [Cryptophyta sp. CCMP2293]
MCDWHSSNASMLTQLCGMVAAGAWGIFKGVHFVPLGVLSTFAGSVRKVVDALRARAETVLFEGGVKPQSVMKSVAMLAVTGDRGLKEFPLELAEESLLEVAEVPSHTPSEVD